MEKQEVSTDRRMLNDYKAYLGCCSFVVIGLSLFHMGFEWVGWGVIIVAWACWITVAAMSFNRYMINERGGE